ncbi:MAG: GNAT family N-acetyltransferase [Planctomycetaceae bacterium]|jgi:ribosomal protein S18 acetylase RimI-like enzyme|nr:GNAT family N-acetyltransferase [Planctomycetaceae bacterium]
MTTSKIRLRLGAVDDTATVLRFIRELADYEKLSDKVFITDETLREWILSRRVEVLLAESDNGDEAVGFALYYFTYSTFSGRSGLYIEDLFVRPQFRRRGIGTMFFREIAKIAVERNCFRVDWVVLDWNVNSIAFYKRLGAHSVDEWLTYRLDGNELNKLAMEKS